MHLHQYFLLSVLVRIIRITRFHFLLGFFYLVIPSNIFLHCNHLKELILYICKPVFVNIPYFLRMSKVNIVNLTCIISGAKNVSFPLKVSIEKAYWMPLLLLKWHISNRKYSFLNNTIKNIDIKGSLISFITIAPGLFMFLNTNELVPQ